MLYDIVSVAIAGEPRGAKQLSFAIVVRKVPVRNC